MRNTLHKRRLLECTDEITDVPVLFSLLDMHILPFDCMIPRRTPNKGRFGCCGVLFTSEIVIQMIVYGLGLG